ncbi:MAG: 50S ribosomal protein L1, partial [Proteobacteria bacterium]|nr:50S ribosomal protein L1 [Pseudomonadota bacterium]
GKRSFSTEDLVANLSAFMNHLSGMRPAAVKGNFVRRISVSTTMSPGAFIEYGG